jgi:tryptophanyl-tRNA synthetase
MRPTGRLHIGHYFGALKNWIDLQNKPQEFECFFFVADWHALTSDYADTSQIAQNSLEIGTDWLAAGLDPAKCVLFQQSQVKEHAELNLLLSMVTPLGWLERVPTYKEQLENIKDKDLHTYGFLGYPVLQAADIVMYGQPDADLVVPVGEDQVSHVELSREVVRRFNTFYGVGISEELLRDSNWLSRDLIRHFRLRVPELPAVAWGEDPKTSSEMKLALERAIRNQVFEEGYENLLGRIAPELRKFFKIKAVLSEPEAMLTQTPRISGTDGRKMSKSYNNFISLSESDESIRDKTRVMMTDPARQKRTDKGDPAKCPAFSWHRLFSTPETIAWSDQGCRTAGIGCIECKAAMAEHLIKWIEPIRARRQRYEAKPGEVIEILDEGSKKARRVAEETMERVRRAVFHWDEKRAELSQPASAKDVSTGR